MLIKTPEKNDFLTLLNNQCSSEFLVNTITS
jgi:hypothetical protein